MTPTPRTAAALLLAAACAAPRPIAPTAAPPRLVLPTAPCGAYGDDGPSDRTALEARGWTALTGALRARGAGVRPSGALDRAARLLAAGAPHPGAPPLGRERVQRALRQGGAHDPAPTAHLASGPPDEALAALLARIGPGDATHAGIGEHVDAGVHHLVVLLSHRRARLDRFPGSVAVGAEETLGGELLGLLHPRAYVTRPDGASAEVALRGGREFAVALRFADPGRHQVEIVGTGERGTEVAALLTVSVGGAPCAAPTAAPRELEPADSPGAEAAVIDAANRTRAEHGLPPLEPSREVASVARSHSQRMLAARAVAHVLPGGGDLSERLAAGRVPFRHALENLASGATALDAHAATEASPAHLANLLSATATRIGVGVARGALATGEPIVYVAEILVEPPDDTAGDRLGPDVRVREALWRERSRRGLPPLTNDLTLEAIAREAARRMRALDSGEIEGVTEAALKAVRKLAAADAFIARAPDEAVRSRNLTDARFRRVGVGVVPGDSPRFGPARLFIAVVYGD